MPPRGYPHDEEGTDSHELGPGPFSQHYRQANPYSHPVRSADHNAFGDDSDSEEQQHHEQDEDEEPEFDVYKDFNNQGVRYATLLKGDDNQARGAHGEDDEVASVRSQKIQSPVAPHPKEKYTQAQDLLTDRDPTSPSNSRFRLGQDKLKTTSKFPSRGKFSEWKDGGNRWRIGSIVAFIAVSCFGVVVFFMVPRQPFISFELPVRIHNMTDNNLFFSARNPTNFSFDARLEITLDGRNSYLPTLVRDFRVTVNDLGSTPDSVQVGKGGRRRGFTCSSRGLTTISTDLHFFYDAKDPSDQLWQQWRKACGNIAESIVNGTITRPSLQLYVLISFKVIGLLGTKYDSTQLNNVGCPAELPANAPSF